MDKWRVPETFGPADRNRLRIPSDLRIRNSTSSLPRDLPRFFQPVIEDPVPSAVFQSKSQYQATNIASIAVMGGETPHLAPAPASTLPRLAERPVGQRITKIYTDRLKQFTSTGQYEGQNLLSRFNEAVNSDEDHVNLSVYSVPNLQRPSFNEATSQEFEPTSVGQSFGPSWSTHWFRIRLKIPEEMRHKERLEFHWDANNEGLVWSTDGRPLQGLTGGGERIEWIIPDEWRDGEEHMFYIEMACNGMFGERPRRGLDSTTSTGQNLCSQQGTDHRCQLGCARTLLRLLDHWRCRSRISG
ncbi:uncharacterized protein N7477_007045 [Penicillium maclennaniae]|uniref:uncharacterized protein n=1 Tax=Penicillium maclennaniae TaxID=1343394 RepID=UPI002540E87D|nr:uncharacterized protein N7477_007045 [Penicillium maclennaniae]KAJ5668475.1 hypothetical protein N7477_007045 [Penicillium maclennaniae]